MKNEQKPSDEPSQLSTFGSVVVPEIKLPEFKSIAPSENKASVARDEIKEVLGNQGENDDGELFSASQLRLFSPLLSFPEDEPAAQKPMVPREYKVTPIQNVNTNCTATNNEAASHLGLRR